MIERSKIVIRALLPKDGFARGVSVLVGGTAGAQILLVLTAPILTRLYTPEDFGLLAVYASLLAIIGVISSLRYELAIPLPEDDVEAANVAVLSLLLLCISTAITTILVFMLGTNIAELLSVPVVANYLWLLPVGVLLSGAYSVFNYWSVRTKCFSAIAQTKLIQAIAMLAIQLATFKFGGIGLLLGQVAGQSAGTTSLARLALAMQAFKQVSWVGVKKASGRYRRFPIFSSWGALINVASWQIPVLMLGAFFPPAIVGFYSLGLRLIQMPLNLIGVAISQVFFQFGAEAHKKGDLSRLVEELSNRMLVLGLLPCMILMVIGADLFAFVFGAEWREAGVFTQILAPWALVWFLSSSLSTVYAIQERQKQELIIHGAIFITRIVAIVVGGSLAGPRTALALFSVGGILSYGYLLHTIFVFSGVDYQVILYQKVQKLALGLAYLAPILIASNLTQIPDIGVLLLSAVMLAIFYLRNRHYLLKLNPDRSSSES